MIVESTVALTFVSVDASDNISRLVSTSAASFGSIGVLFFSELQSDAVFSDRGMDTNTTVELLFGHLAFHCDANTLGDFTSIGCANMEADYSLIVHLVDEDFDIAVTLRTGLVVSPF